MTYTPPTLRARIHVLREEGYTYQQIASRENIPLSTVAGICKRTSEAQSYDDKPRSGRPRIFSDYQERKVKSLIISRKFETAVDIQAHLEVQEDTKVSTQTIRNTLQRRGLHSAIKSKKPFLSYKHRRQRMEFARKYKNWTIENWKQVIWSDESKFEIFGSRCHQYCWKTSGDLLKDSYVQPTVKFNGGSNMIWGCMTSQGVGSLCHIEETLDGELYREILKDDLLVHTLQWYGLKVKDIIFQQDNDPKHTAKLTKQWLIDNKVTTLDWPSQSPDLNPIEHLWDEIDRRLRKLPSKITSKKDLWEKIQDIWNQISIIDCLKLIETMPTRIQDVLKAKGSYTRW
jgi:transposase